MFRRRVITTLGATALLLAAIASAAFAQQGTPAPETEPAKFEITTGGGLEQYLDFDQVQRENTTRGLLCEPEGKECGP